MTCQRRTAAAETAAPEMKMADEKKNNLKELLEEGSRLLAERGIEEARTDAWLLMEESFGITRSWYFAHSETVPETEKILHYLKLLEQRGKRVPLQQLLGKAWFYGMCFHVNEHVLIPRQDTEILVEEALKRIQPGMRILDLCTGSGCVLLAILANGKEVSGVGSDLSEKALLVAEKNAADLGISAQFCKSNLYENLSGKFDMIVSNPPYIRTDVIPSLMPEVRDHEPLMALDGHEDGLYFYREILKGADRFLMPGGWICFEIGFDQGEALRTLMQEYGMERIEIRKDLAGLDRVAVGRLAQKGDDCAAGNEIKEKE